MNFQFFNSRYFHEALKTLNPWMNEGQIAEAQKALENRLSTSSPLQVNEEKYSHHAYSLNKFFQFFIIMRNDLI